MRLGSAAFCRYSLLNPWGASALEGAVSGAVTVADGFIPPVNPPCPSGVTLAFAPHAIEPANAAAPNLSFQPSVTPSCPPIAISNI